ncbi:hypothetical protein WA026_019309 [Henosepilachna vigintioctopunctata]|uniref:Uncharacterized protein n=1 Tax=Henosepilachna vigintioctopunctata TaxID=420089 RepID=A0AAW1U3Y8_9CUCU
MNKDRLGLPSLDNPRGSRSTSVKLSSRFLRSASEPPNGNKSTEEETRIEEISRKSFTSSIQYFEVDGIQVEEYERVPTANETRTIDFINNVGKSMNGQMLNPTKAPESYTNDKQRVYPVRYAKEERINGRSRNKFQRLPTTKDEIESNTENAAEYLIHFNKQTCDTFDGANVEKPKILQKTKETENNTASTTLSSEKPSEVLAMFKEPNSSTVVLTERSSSSIKYNEISKNDLEFLRRQLSIADKHLLQEALTSGTS